METIIKIIVVVITIVLSVTLISLFSGTVVYFIWPIAIPAAFPGLVNSGVLAPNISWWASVCLVWIFATMFKSSKIENKKD